MPGLKQGVLTKQEASFPEPMCQGVKKKRQKLILCLGLSLFAKVSHCVYANTVNLPEASGPMQFQGGTVHLYYLSLLFQHLLTYFEE